MVDLLFYGFLHSAWMREILYPIVHCFKQNSILEVSGPGAQTIESAQLLRVAQPHQLPFLECMSLHSPICCCF